MFFCDSEFRAYALIRQIIQIDLYRYIEHYSQDHYNHSLLQLDDLFLINLVLEVCNFADDNTLYSCGQDFEEIATCLGNDVQKCVNWFRLNGMVANAIKLMFLGLKKKHELRLNINGNKIQAANHVKLLGIEIDNKLNFDRHDQTLSIKINKKVNVFLD